jgi:hypothetical protein
MSTNAAENLVADYAFIGYHQKKRVEITTNTYLRTGVYSTTTRGDYVVKQRDKANPYGFGFTFDTLSWRQMAILAALGLSRS